MPIYLYMNKELVVYLAFKGAINPIRNPQAKPVER